MVRLYFQDFHLQNLMRSTTARWNRGNSYDEPTALFMYLAEFLDKLHHSYQVLICGVYRPGQVVVVPTLSSPQTKSQQTAQSGQDSQSKVGPVDDVDVHAFLEVALQIVHSSMGSFR